MNVPKEHASRITEFPATLRALIEAELASRNEIVEVASCFPAPPVGAYVKLRQAGQHTPARFQETALISTTAIVFDLFRRSLPTQSGSSRLEPAASGRSRSRIWDAIRAKSAAASIAAEGKRDPTARLPAAAVPTLGTEASG